MRTLKDGLDQLDNLLKQNTISSEHATAQETKRKIAVIHKEIR